GTPAIPWARGARLAPGVRELHTGHGAVPGNEPEDTREHLHVIVFPEAEVVRTDTPFGRHGGGLGEHGAGAANRPAAQVHQVPIVSEPVATRVLAHRRHDDAI